jgi:hypothetical protein
MEIRQRVARLNEDAVGDRYLDIFPADASRCHF